MCPAAPVGLYVEMGTGVPDRAWVLPDLYRIQEQVVEFVRPQLAACASPHSWAISPLDGPEARSHAIRPADPRRKENGVAAIRRSRSGTSSGNRSRFVEST